MPLAKFPKTPYLLTQSAGGVYTALASVGAVPADHRGIPRWNPFARNDTRYRNVVLVGLSADSELLFLQNHEFFNPYGFATTTVALDCQRLYEMLVPGADPIGLDALVRYCFPSETIEHLHNAGNDAYFELQCCLVLLRKLAERYAAESIQMAAFPKIWDAVFVSMDIEAYNGRKDRLTEFGFACLDSRNITSIHNNSYEKHITASHLIIKGAVPKMINGVRQWKGTRYGGNYETDSFYPRLGASKEIWPNQIGCLANRLFFIPSKKAWDWIAPAGLEPQDSGECVIQQSSPYWTEVARHPGPQADVRNGTETHRVNRGVNRGANRGAHRDANHETNRGTVQIGRSWA